MDLVFDPAIALFAGLNVVPKRSYLASYSSRVDHRANLRPMDAWFEQVEPVGLPHGSSLDLDFHTVPANTAAEPLEKHYVSSRSRRQKGILVFVARDAEQRVLCYGNAGIPKAEHQRIFVRFYRLGNELRRETQGTGIGLSLVKHIVEGNGGTVRVLSEGRGVTFEMIFTLKI